MVLECVAYAFLWFAFCFKSMLDYLLIDISSLLLGNFLFGLHLPGTFRGRT